MRKKSHSSEIIIPLITILSDIIAIESAFLLSYWLRFYSPLTEIFIVKDNVIPPLIGYITMSLMIIPFWLLIFQSRKMYRPRRTNFIFDELFLISRLSTFAIIFSFGLIFFYRDFPYSRLVFIFIWALSIILIMIGRYIVIKLEKNLYNKGIGLKTAVVIGSNEQAATVYENFIKHPYTGFKILGYLNDQDSYDKKLFADKNCLGGYEELAAVIKSHQIETVLLIMPSSQHEKLYDIMKMCEGENVEFLLMPDFLEIITSSVRVNEIDGIPFLRIKGIPMNIWNRILKRLFDILFASITLLVTSSLFIIIAVLIKLTSKGPVFYKQERLSMTGMKFQMLKFRSMIQNAEHETGAVFTTKHDPRNTPIGNTLRKYSLDELPQFINVIKGEMSIVGPRPEREYFINLMKDKIPKYLERHRIKCGITGWAQVNGLRGTDSPLEKRVEYDIYYIENWSLVFDLKIIFKTLREMIFSKTAF